MTIAQWNVSILLDRKTTDRTERRTSLVAMKLVKYNIDIAVLTETRFHASGSLNNLEYTFCWSGKPNGERGWSRICNKKRHRGKTDRNSTSSEWQDYDNENPSDKGSEFYNSQCICSNNGEPRREQGGLLQSAKWYTQKHPQHRQASADMRVQCKDRKRN